MIYCVISMVLIYKIHDIQGDFLLSLPYERRIHVMLSICLDSTPQNAKSVRCDPASFFSQLPRPIDQESRSQAEVNGALYLFRNRFLSEMPLAYQHPQPRAAGGVGAPGSIPRRTYYINFPIAVSLISGRTRQSLPSKIYPIPGNGLCGICQFSSAAGFRGEKKMPRNFRISGSS